MAVKSEEKEVRIGVWILGSRVGIAYRPQYWGSAIADMHMVVPICGFILILELDAGVGLDRKASDWGNDCRSRLCWG